MLTWAIASLLKASIGNDQIASGLGAMLVLAMVADVAIVGLVAMVFWG